MCASVHRFTIFYILLLEYGGYIILHVAVNYLSKIRLCTHHNIDSIKSIPYGKKKRGAGYYRTD